VRAGEGWCGQVHEALSRSRPKASWVYEGSYGHRTEAGTGWRSSRGRDNVRRLSHVSHTVKSHKVQSVKSCESAGESAETVGGGSVVAVGVGGKDRIVIKKVGYA